MPGNASRPTMLRRTGLMNLQSGLDSAPRVQKSDCHVHCPTPQRDVGMPPFRAGRTSSGSIEGIGKTSAVVVNLVRRPSRNRKTSRVNRFNVAAAASITCRPDGVEPVKDIFAMSGWRVRKSPRSLLSVTTLTTPSGKMSFQSTDHESRNRRGGCRL
jgi:hypothetical protein